MATLLFVFTGCNIDTTKELIIFEKNIGMPDSFLGKYETISL